VVVIGGGIVGVSAAWHLARCGLKVVLCEKGTIGGEQSGRNWGWCRNTLRDPAEIPLMQQSMRDWRDPNIFGNLDTGFRTSGIAYLTYPDQEETQTAWLRAVDPFGLDSHMLSKGEIEKLFPHGTGKATGALYTASDGCAEPGFAAVAIAKDARRLGALVFTNCAVRGIETIGGHLNAIVTEKGTIQCSSAILAGGIWSRLFAGSVDIDFPQLKVLGSVSITDQMPGGPEVSFAAKHYGWRKRIDGSYVVSRANATYVDIVPDSFRLAGAFIPLLKKSLLDLRFRVGRQFISETLMPRKWHLDTPSPFEKVRIADPAPVTKVLQRARNDIGKEIPFFQNAHITRQWGGYIDVTPDALPSIGMLDELPGLVLASGFSGHGFGIGPGAGRLAAEIAINNHACVDASAFSPARFKQRNTART
jgi:glycine/D-amino acid oxidase-like deaminating enzyme